MSALPLFAAENLQAGGPVVTSASHWILDKCVRAFCDAASTTWKARTHHDMLTMEMLLRDKRTLEGRLRDALHLKPRRAKEWAASLERLADSVVTLQEHYHLLRACCDDVGVGLDEAVTHVQDGPDLLKIARPYLGIGSDDELVEMLQQGSGR